MLRADVVYRGDEQRNISIIVEASHGGLATTLHMPTFSEYKYLTGYLPWSQSGFAMLAAAFAEFTRELSTEVGPFAQLEIRITSMAAGAKATLPLCVISFTCGPKGRRIQVEGPVLRMTGPVFEVDTLLNLDDAIQFLLKKCDPTIADEQQSPFAVPTYSGGTSEPFVFISELRGEVQPWFVTLTKLKNPAALQRNGQTASASAYEDYCWGRLR